VCAFTGKLVGGPFVDEHTRFLKRTVTLAVEFVGVFGRERHVLEKQKLQLNNGVGHQILVCRCNTRQKAKMLLQLMTVNAYEHMSEGARVFT